jgi:hypothetical protein
MSESEQGKRRPVGRDERGRMLPGGLAPRRRRGPPLGNLNGCKFPFRTFWRRGVLRPQDRWIEPLVATHGEALIADKGGRENMSGAELHMVELAQLARGCVLLVLFHSRQHGGLIGDGKGPDLAAALARFMQVERQCLVALGLERRARPVPRLSELLAQKPAVAGTTER